MIVLAPQKEYACYFGRYSPEKGVESLIEVCKCLPEINFRFAGCGSLESKINEVKNIENMGFLSGGELKKLIRGARFSIYPSEWYENCPFSVMESQLYGTPVLGADIGGIPELIQNGVTGRLFVAGDRKDLKDKIVEMWNETELHQNIRNAHFDFDGLEQYTNRLLEIYQEST